MTCIERHYVVKKESVTRPKSQLIEVFLEFNGAHHFDPENDMLNVKTVNRAVLAKKHLKCLIIHIDLENIGHQNEYSNPKNLQFMILSFRHRLLKGLFDSLNFYYSKENFFVKKKEEFSYVDFAGLTIAEGEGKGGKRFGLG